MSWEPRTKNQDSQKNFSGNLGSWFLENTEISVFLGNQEPRTKILRKTFPGILVLGSWKILKFQYFTEISVFLGNQEPRTKILRKTFPGILVLGSWKILKFQYFTEISVFLGNQEPRTKILRKDFSGNLGSWFLVPGKY